MSNDIAIESLEKRIDDLNQEAWDLRVIDSPKALIISKESVELARKTNYKKGLAHALQLLGFCYVRHSKNDEALPLLKESLAMFESMNDLKGMAVGYEYLAIIQRTWGDLGGSLELLFRSLDITEPNNITEIIATNHYQLGVTYKHLGDFENALDHFFKSMAAGREINNSLFESYSINLIGSIYFENGNYEKALDYYQQGLAIRQHFIDKWAEAGSLDNIGFTYLKLKDYDQAISYCKLSLEISRSSGDKRGQANALLHLAEIYKQKNDAVQATKFSNESLELRRASGDKRGEAEILLFLADLHKTQPEHNLKVLEWLNNSLNIAEEIKALDLLSKTRFHLYEYYKYKGDFEEAVKNLDQYTNLEKEFHKNTIDQKVANLEISHKAEVMSQRNKELTELNEQIEKANAELRIESSLERVRTAAMAMKEPADMLEVCKIISAEMELMNVKDIRNVQTAIINEEKGIYLNYEYFTQYKRTDILEIEIKLHPAVEEFANEMLKSKDAIFFKSFEGEALDDWREYRKKTNQDPDPILDNATSLHYYFYSIGSGALGLSTYSKLNDDEIELFKRFRNVFELAYRRFVDIEKAEAQAREAQIEAGLERVRSRSMAMHKSEELSEVVTLVYEEIKPFGFATAGVELILIDEKNELQQYWVSTAQENKIIECFNIPTSIHPHFQKQWKAWKDQIPRLTLTLEGQEKKAFDQLIFTKTDFKNLSDDVKEFILNHGNADVFSHVIMKYGLLEAVDKSPLSEEKFVILERFAKVFEQTYTRFLDLQKAEAQAREAQIEAALERVRAASMAMHKSEELAKVVTVLYNQLKVLEIDFFQLFSSILYLEKGNQDVWMSPIEGILEEPFYYNAPTAPWENTTIKDWKEGKEFSYVSLQGKHAIQQFFHVMEEMTGTDYFNKVIKNHVYNFEKLESTEVNHKYGRFGLVQFVKATAEEKNILKRFSKVFEQAYTRFLDLQRAEAQTREAKIEAALERVRARALAMQEPEELKDVAQVLRNEMGLLGIEELETCSIYIHERDSDTAECWYALKDTKDATKTMVADHFHLDLNDTWVGREMKTFYDSDEKQTSIVMQGVNRKEWIEYCYKHSPVFSGFYGEAIPDRTYHLYKFSHGYIGAAAPGDISAESWKLLSRAASVFSLAYSRFKDLTQARTDLIKLKEEKKRVEDALTELQATQKQLIQAEKMASLGELTAGIAHEIQNPLNFVNNFSDVSNELLEEMKSELATGNMQSAIEIAKDVKDNLEKILHHGKRADAIVKGMLQHSRSSSGQKEPTDINALADEYLRLAYHGLRAKDKSFNATMKTDFDASIGNINIIPQDIGRVVLNLINNAFYAVDEKKKKYGDGYEPIVTVSTKTVKSPSGDLGALISVKDNGNGIPQKVLDKIFQPFFTTKPTGQGTGLGLSLSYDIITKGHDGEIKVETKEGQGSAFIISLPMK